VSKEIDKIYGEAMAEQQDEKFKEGMRFLRERYGNKVDKDIHCPLTDHSISEGDSMKTPPEVPGDLKIFDLDYENLRYALGNLQNPKCSWESADKIITDLLKTSPEVPGGLISPNLPGKLSIPEQESQGWNCPTCHQYYQYYEIQCENCGSLRRFK